MSRTKIDDIMESFLRTSDLDANDFYSSIKYVGFNKDEILNLMMKSDVPSAAFKNIAIAGALRGPKKAASLTVHGGKSALDYNIVATVGAGNEGLSVSRITSVLSSQVAFILKKIDGLPKRVDCDCPAWLQFPAAAGIKMPDDLRASHIEFSKIFSEMIGGKFNMVIYEAMANSAQESEDFQLF